MKQKKKLKIVFDFIADYLSEEKPTKKIKKSKKETKELLTEEKVITKSDDNFTRAYEIMKKIDEYDARKITKSTNNINEVLRTRTDLDFDEFSRIDTKIKNIKKEWSNECAKPLMEMLDSARNLEKRVSEREKMNGNAFTQKTGITLDSTGKVIRVGVKPLTEDRGEIERHINEIKNQSIKPESFPPHKNEVNKIKKEK